MNTLCTNTYCKNMAKMVISSVRCLWFALNRGLAQIENALSPRAPTIAMYRIMIVTFCAKNVRKSFTTFPIIMKIASVLTVTKTLSPIASH